MFDKLITKKPTSTSNLEENLAAAEKNLDLHNRIQKVQAAQLQIAGNTPIDMKKVMDMIGTLGSDASINQDIIDKLTDALGNNPDPIKLTKYFSGMIAQRVLNVADVRKIPGNIFASKGGTPLDITSSLVYVQPVHLFGASSLIQPARYQQAPLSLAFDSDGQITIGSDKFSNYTTSTQGTFASPFVAHLFVLKRNNTLNGDAKFFVESEFGYRAGLQLVDDSAAALMLNHIKAIKVTATQALDVSAPPDLTANLSFAADDLDEQFEIDTTDAMDVNVEGTNVSITHYQLPMYTPIAEAILAALISGRLDMLPTWILNTVSAQFKL